MRTLPKLLVLLVINLQGRASTAFSSRTQWNGRSTSAHHHSPRHNNMVFHRIHGQQSARAFSESESLDQEVLPKDQPFSSRRQWLRSAAASTVSVAAAIATTSTTLVNPASSLAATPNTQLAAICDPSVSIWQKDQRILYLLGTAHISEQSAALAGQLVQQVHPNAVFVELDLRRLGGGSSSNNNNGYPVLASPPDINPTRILLTPEITTTNAQGESVNAASTTRLVIPQVPNVPPTIPATTTTTAAVTSSSVNSAATGSSTSAAASLMPPLEEASSPSSPQKGGLFSGIRQNILNAGAALVGNAIKGMYQNLGQAGFNPGEEFTLAMRMAKQQGDCDIILGDRDVQVTLQRLTQALAVTDLDKLTNPDSELEKSMNELFGGGEATPDTLLPGSNAAQENPQQFKQDLTKYVETLKSRDRVRQVMAQLNEAAPALVQVMLNERDAYMATGMDALNEYEVITAVFGVAHQDGIERNLQAKGWKQVSIPCQQKQEAMASKIV